MFFHQPGEQSALSNDTDTPEPGVYPDVPFAEYLAWNACNNSKLGQALRSPRHYYCQPPRADRPTFQLGRLVHAGKLQPETLLNDYIVLPDLTDGIGGTRPTATKKYKERLQEFRDAHASKELVTPEQYAVLQGTLASLACHERAAHYFGQPAATEVSILWRDQDTDLLCKARLDHWSEQAARITDLKTTDAASHFIRSIRRYDYARQAAFYIDGTAAATGVVAEFCLVAVEKDPPYGVRAAPLSGADVRRGREEYKRALAAIAEGGRALAEGKLPPSYGDPDVWRTDDRCRIRIGGKWVQL